MRYFALAGYAFVVNALLFTILKLDACGFPISLGTSYYDQCDPFTVKILGDNTYIRDVLPLSLFPIASIILVWSFWKFGKCSAWVSTLVVVPMLPISIAVYQIVFLQVISQVSK